MAIRVVCSCGRSRLFPDTSAGQTSKCRKCGAGLTVAGETIVPPRVSPLRRILLLALVLIIPSVVGIAYWRTRQPRFTSAAEEYREGSKAAIDPAVDGPRIERLFAALAAASKEGNETAFGHCFHGRRMLAEIEIRGGIEAVGMRRDELSLEDEIYATMRDWCEQLKNSASAWQKVVRCTTRFLDGRGEAECFVVMRSPDQISRFRFWVLKENNEWLIFDYESLEDSFRMSTSNGKLLVRQSRREMSGHKLDQIDGMIDKVNNWLARDNPDQALEILTTAETLADSTPLLPTIKLQFAEVLHLKGRPEEALLKVDDALRLKKDFPQAVQCRGSILYSLQRFDEGIAAQESFMKSVGDDAIAYFWIGRCREAQGKRTEAVDAYRKGAACDETETINRERLQKLGESAK